MTEMIFYSVGDLEQMTGWSAQTIKRRAKDGILPKPITWRLYGEQCRKPLQWLKTDIDATIASWSNQAVNQ